jgi:BirA family biotin operon repressor/biotin-[acetyl-CoA-carboxylase] ligase
MTRRSGLEDGPTLPPDFDLIVLDSVDSTNAEAIRRAESCAAGGTLIWARSQTAGRGRRGRAWTSPPGNLYASLLLRPDSAPGEAGQLGFVAGLALREAIVATMPAAGGTELKWPNDLVVEGRKLAGILLESRLLGGRRLDWLVIGTGVNVASHPEDAERPATSLAALGAPPSVPALLSAYGRAMAGWLPRWRDEGFAPVRSDWLRHAAGRELVLQARLTDETVEGRFADLDETGALVLELPDGARRRVLAGEVFALPR